MRKKPSIIKSFLGTLVVLVVVYFSVNTLASNGEIVSTEGLRGVPIEIESVPGIEIVTEIGNVDLEVKGTKVMHNKLKDAPPRVIVSVEEKEGVEVGNIYEESERIKELQMGEQAAEEDENKEDEYEKEEEGLKEEENEEDNEGVVLDIKEYFNDVVRVEGLDGYIHELLTEIPIEVVAVEPEEVDVKVKIRGVTDKSVTKVEVKDSIKGYFNESDKERIEEVNVYVDVDSIDKDGETIGVLGIVDKEGKEMSTDRRLDRDNVRVKVYF